MHAALDRLEELLGSPKKNSLGRFFRGSHWLGSICPMEEYEVPVLMNPRTDVAVADVFCLPDHIHVSDSRFMAMSHLLT